jgi:eukaryotic-like serine/threonine-protein kinase
VTAPIKDTDLLQLAGVEVHPSDAPGVHYVLGRVIGEGAHGVVFLAERHDGGVPSSAVVKLLRPRAVRELAGLAGAALLKEVAALKRLASGSPTPHVVRFLDAGVLRLGTHALELPWLAVEHVDGGAEGVTLRARVEGCVQRSQFAFEPARARAALRCICDGTTAMHAAGVLHRDIAPGNVLCSGSGASESFKLADFGLARVSSAVTFGNVLLGTPGYCSPEQSFPDKIGVGPYSDVFAIACTAFFMLTGEHYFPAPSVPETLVAVYAPERRSLFDAARLHPALGNQRETCVVLDALLAKSTHADPARRPQSAAEFAAELLLVVSPP